MIRTFIVLVFLSIPALVVYLNYQYFYVPGSLLFSFFVLMVMFERVWETFYTQKGQDIRKFRGDWSLIATSFFYYITSIIIILEFYHRPSKSILLVIIGILIFLFALWLRIYSMHVLHDQWNIHIGSELEKNLSVVNRGPYKFVRHPIYLGIILDLLGIALITNAFYSILIIIIINSPLYFWRAFKEEKNNIKKFGDEYVKYCGQTSFMFPFFHKK